MKKYKISKFKKGWLVGNFKPSILRTKSFEFGVKYYKKGDVDQTHLHKKSEEITVIVYGSFTMNKEKLSSGDVVFVEKNEIVSFVCVKNGAIAVIKKPSIIGDKFIAN